MRWEAEKVLATAERGVGGLGRQTGCSDGACLAPALPDLSFTLLPDLRRPFLVT